MALNLDDDEEIKIDTRMSWIGSFLNLAAIITLSYMGWIQRFGTRYTVTNKRVYKRYGILRVDETIVRAEDIRDVSMKQGLISRMFRYGTVTIATAGTGGKEVSFTRVGNPSKVRDAIEEVRREASATTD